MRDPIPLRSKDYIATDKQWAFFSEASNAAARSAAYSTALSDRLVQADELGVSEDDRVSTGTLIFNISARTFSQALRAQVYSTEVRRDLAINTIQISSETSSMAVNRISRETPFLFKKEKKKERWVFLGRDRFGHFYE